MHVHCLSLDRKVKVFLFIIYFTDFTIKPLLQATEGCTRTLYNLSAVDYNQTDKIKCSNCTN